MDDLLALNLSIRRLLEEEPVTTLETVRSQAWLATKVASELDFQVNGTQCYLFIKQPA